MINKIDFSIPHTNDDGNNCFRNTSEKNNEKEFTNAYKNDVSRGTISLYRGEEKNMSLVGLLACKDGIVGIGDYRSTKTYYGGISHKEGRRKVQKVFANNKFVMVTCGTNVIDKDNVRENLEDFVNRTLDDDMDYRYFFNNFANYANNADYSFLVGTKLVSGEYAFYEIKCLRGKIEEYPRFANPLFSGDPSYFEMLSYIPIDYSKMSVLEGKEKLENVFAKLIALKDESTEYCSVGLEGEEKPLALIFK